MAGFNITSQILTSLTAIAGMSGEMNVGDFEALQTELNRLRESGIIGLVLDVNGLDSLSSAGLGVILDLARVLEERRGKLVLAAPKPKLLGLIEMLGVKEGLNVVDTPEEARRLVSSLE